LGLPENPQFQDNFHTIKNFHSISRIVNSKGRMTSNWCLALVSTLCICSWTLLTTWLGSDSCLTSALRATWKTIDLMELSWLILTDPLLGRKQLSIYFQWIWCWVIRFLPKQPIRTDSTPILTPSFKTILNKITRLWHPSLSMLSVSMYWEENEASFLLSINSCIQDSWQGIK